MIGSIPFLWIGIGVISIIYLFSSVRKERQDLNLSWRFRLFTCLCLCFFMSCALLMSYISAYVKGGYDVSVFSQVVHNISMGRGTLSTLGPEKSMHLGLHFHPILFPVGWIHSIFQGHSPAYFTLYGFLLSSILIVTLFVFFPSGRLKRNLNPNSDSFVDLYAAVHLCCFWGMTSALSVDFHVVTMGALYSVAGILAFEKGMQKVAIGFMLMAACCGEMFLIAVPTVFALWWFREHAHWKAGIALLVAFLFGFFLFGLYVFKFRLIWGGPEVTPPLSRYRCLGQDLWDVGLSPFVVPQRFFSHLFSVSNLLFFARMGLLLVPTVFLLLLARLLFGYQLLQKPTKKAKIYFFAACLIGIFPFAKIILSCSPHMAEPGYHYLADCLPSISLFLLALLSCIRFDLVQTRFRPWGLLVLSGLIVQIPFPLSLAQSIDVFAERNSLFPAELRNKLRSIPDDVSIFVNNLSFSLELADRRDLRCGFSRIDEEELPQMLVLGWPILHGIETISPQIFGKSFRKSSETIFQTEYGSSGAVYEFERYLDGGVPSGAYFYRRIE